MSASASARDFLFELRTEELPPRTLLTLSNALTEDLVRGIDALGIAHGAVHPYATPRRLALRIEALAEHQPDRPLERRGPPLASSFDAEGAPTQAAQAFARSCGVEVAALSQLKTDKGAWLQFRGTQRGAATTSLLGGVIDHAIAALPIARRMRWGANAAEFVRPVHGVVVLYGADVVPVQVLGLSADRITYGHRFHAPGAIVLGHPRDYESTLHHARVVADFGKRRELIRSGVLAAAANTPVAITASGDMGAMVRAADAAAAPAPLIEAALLDEVTALVEWPVPVAGQFEQRFLRLPREVVIATVQEHQRYFAVQDASAQLTGWFVTVANLESRDPQKVREGNERVVRPRLSDAAFFWDQDRKRTLEQHAARLADVTFQTQLGSYADKTQRVAALAAAIGTKIGAGPDVAQAAALAKADLMTAMVGEFPELQGTMGRYYAEAEGLARGVALAIGEHYRPRYAGDAIPGSAVGQAVALADKLDTLVGILAIGQRPTGAKDPFGLRRAALGVLRILLEARLDLDLRDLIAFAAAAQPVQRPELVAEAFEFMTDRLKGMLADMPGTTPEMVDAVLANPLRSPLDAVTRLGALQDFLTLPDAAVLAAMNKRIGNILKKTAVAADATVDTGVFSEAAEHALHAALSALRQPVLDAAHERRYAASFTSLTALRTPIDDFFDHVMVMDENPARRNNRLALLRDVQLLLSGVVDLSRLPG